ncbi:T9SS type A sorting domain-containing protein [Fulvivirga ulvae]|uniref:T9SS type A sorting domain-containing protein n=1 Tax=Fulvivirga ulvae TaxID=2904245 RepID=UPI001F3EA439|nr:T9SS type A sorting domain-containing protein [Fulvivirga ulvae]UII32045.1 T9SS type A sorting domain-containing protein [Fulvivirga ulvae]
MKYILTITLIYLLAVVAAHGQDDLFDKEWEIHQYQVTFLEETSDFYNKNSSENIFDFNGIKFSFTSNGVYTTIKGEKQKDGEWSINNNGDSLKIDGRQYHLVELSEENLIFRNYTLEYADTSARLDTVYFYNKLKPVPGSEKVTGIKKQTQENTLAVYPNPSDNIITIRLLSDALKEEHVQYRILNINGKEMDKQPVPKGRSAFDIQIGTLPKGVYILEILNQHSRRLAIHKLLKK